MEKRNIIHRINNLNSELQSLYHQTSVKHNLSDSVSIILYNIYDAGGDTCLLSDIYKNSGISKQTINSAIRKMEADGLLFLEAHDGRSKNVVLTERGRDLVNISAARLYEAENAVFDTWTEEEINTYIRLMEKFKEGFQAKIAEI